MLVAFVLNSAPTCFGTVIYQQCKLDAQDMAQHKI